MGATEDLVLLSFIMLVLTFVMGLIPIKLYVGPQVMNLIATLACGLLLGVAFIVILPEGIEMLLHGLEHGHDHEEEHHSDEHDEHEDEDHHSDEHDEHDDHDDHDDHDEHEGELDGPMAGLAIIAGIILMMVAHSFGPGHSHGHGHGGKSDKGSSATSAPKNDIELVVTEGANVGTVENSEDSVIANEPSPDKGQILASVTLGLLVHATFDGVALGIITAGGEDAGISWVVFGALIGHKAPEAISLSLILLAQGLSALKVVINLFLFSVAAPVGALLTYFIVDAGTESSDNAGEALGYCMLFAGGTFIGVIFEHIVPELKSTDGDRFTLLQLFVFTCGAMIPLAIPHDHGH